MLNRLRHAVENGRAALDTVPPQWTITGAALAIVALVQVMTRATTTLSEDADDAVALAAEAAGDLGQLRRAVSSTVSQLDVLRSEIYALTTERDALVAEVASREASLPADDQDATVIPLVPA